MAMEDVYEIQKLLYSYCWLIDSGDFDGVSELFREADVSFGGKLTYRHEKEGYRQSLKPIKRYKDGTPKTAHMCIDPIVELSEDGMSATARSYTVVTQGITGKFQPQIIWIDRKYDTFIKKDGKWQFASRNFVTRARGNTEFHMDLGDYKKK